MKLILVICVLLLLTLQQALVVSGHQGGNHGKGKATLAPLANGATYAPQTAPTRSPKGNHGGHNGRGNGHHGPQHQNATEAPDSSDGENSTATESPGGDHHEGNSTATESPRGDKHGGNSTATESPGGDQD